MGKESRPHSGKLYWGEGISCYTQTSAYKKTSESWDKFFKNRPHRETYHSKNKIEIKEARMDDEQPWCWICEEYVKEGKCNCDK